ncbi:PAS domain S-box protein [Roseomonas sp. ACRSG]|nr:PAS domain S-box protein [Roseomonas sp. ACRSG]
MSTSEIDRLRQRERLLEAEVAQLRRLLAERPAPGGEAPPLPQTAILGNVLDAAIIASDPEGLVTEWNTGAERILGWTAAEMLGQPLERIFTAEDRAANRIWTEKRQALREGRVIAQGWQLRRDGSRFWASSELTPLQNGDGVPLGFLRLLRDRSDERATNRRLAESEARYRTLFEAIDAGFCIIEMRFDARQVPVDYRFVEVNPAFERQTGLVEAAGRWMRDLAPDHEQHWFDIYGRVALTGEPVRFENAAAALGRWYDVHAFRIGEPEERRVALLFNDISDRRRVELELQKSEAHWRGLFEQLREAFSVCELIRDDSGRAVDWRYLDVNPAWEELTGLSREDTIGHTVRELIPDIEDEWVNDFARVIENGETIAFSRQVGRLGRWYEGRAHPLEGERFVALFLEVTERRRADEEARRLAALVEQSADFIGACGPDGQMVFVNPAGCRLVGLEEAAARGTRITDYFAREERDLVAGTVLPAVQRQGTWQGEFRFRDFRTGAVLPVLFNIFTLRDPQGRPTGYGTVTRDMREMRKAELRRNALLELADRLRDLRDPGTMSLIAAEIIGRTLGVDRAGYGRFAPDGETMVLEQDWVAPGIRSIAGQHSMRDYGSFIEDLQRGQTVVVSDAREDPRMRDSAARVEALSARAIINLPLLEDDRLVAFFFVNQAQPRHWTEEEVTFLRNVADRTLATIARRRAEDDLRSLAGRLEELVAERTRERDRLWELSEDLLLVADYDGHLLRVSPSWSRLLGMEEADLLATHYAQLMHPEDLGPVLAALRDMRATGQEMRFVNRLRDSRGGWRWFAWTVSPEPGGERLSGIGRDVTAEKEQAAAQERLEEQLRQSQKMEAVGQLTGGIAHDFNNLLTGIGGSLELLSTYMAQGRMREMERFIEVAQSATRRAAALTHRLLAFSRRQTLDPRPTDANRLVMGMEELVRRTVGPAITLEVVQAGGLWPILIDHHQLENALLNLCINARDAMPGGGRLRIETANRLMDEAEARMHDLPPGQYVSLCISDTGTGMTPEVAAKAFDPFFTTKPLGQGTGLGLSMVYGFARQSGGQVRIYSDPGKGTTICLYLPRHEGTDAAERMEKAPSELIPTRQGETVLVVDDEPSVRLLVVEILQDLGYVTIEAADGAGGLQVLRSDTRIDLLVTDVGLPGGMNGRQMVDAAREARPDLKVLFITGYTEDTVLGRGQLALGAQILTKPFSMENLAAKVRAMIAQGGAAEAAQDGTQG